MKRLEEIKRRVEAATPGPWFQLTKDADENQNLRKAHVFTAPEYYGHIATCSAREGFGIQAETNADFIAHSRTDIEDLLRVVEIQREALELVANIQHGLNGRNAGRNTFRAIAKKALAEAAKILGDGE